jgi:hypothetical protein
VLKLESGESHPIRHPEFLILMSKHIGIGSPDSDGVQQYELAKVTSVEALVSA